MARYLGPAHPLAQVAARHCQEHLGSLRFGCVGNVACGVCWERAIRDDERVVVLFDLPREIEQDRHYIDEIAVELACKGERVSLTRRERAEAVRRMARKRIPSAVIAARLNPADHEGNAA